MSYVSGRFKYVTPHSCEPCELSTFCKKVFRMSLSIGCYFKLLKEKIYHGDNTSILELFQELNMFWPKNNGISIYRSCLFGSCSGYLCNNKLIHFMGSQCQRIQFELPVSIDEICDDKYSMHVGSQLLTFSKQRVM